MVVVVVGCPASKASLVCVSTGLSSFSLWQADRRAGRREDGEDAAMRGGAPSAPSSRLPIARYEREILYLVEKHATTVVVGHTGSGKTTQIVQYLDANGWTTAGSANSGRRRRVVCTQPREVAVVAVAERVAEELGCAVGDRVGYRVSSFDERVDENGAATLIEFSTDEALLTLLARDPLLQDYSVVVVDEAHERSLATDLVLGLLKKVQKRRPELRIVISSATIDAETIADFFDGAAIISVEGTLHDVEIFYAKIPVSDYVSEAVETALRIHAHERPGDILVFLPTQEDVANAVEMVEQQWDRAGVGSPSGDLMPLPLHAGLPFARQMRALCPAQRNTRKVVIATSMAETSLTIQGVAYVVDSCFERQKFYDPITSLESVVVCPASKASAVQRAGRAGRVRPGKCYRLCTRQTYEADLPSAYVPEMQRCELSRAVLVLKSLGVDSIMTFDWIAPPPAEAMVRALELLHALGALNAESRLTRPLGDHVADLPCHPTIAKCLLAAGDVGCLEEVTTIASVVMAKAAGGSVWQQGRGRKILERRKAKFAVAEGDHITYLNVFKGFLEAKRTQGWCERHCLSYATMSRACDLKARLAAILTGLGVPHSSAAKDVTKIRRALAHGLFANSAVLVSANTDEFGRALYSTVRGKIKMRMHESSVLARNQPQCVLYTSAVQTGPTTHEMFEVTAIDQEWLPEIAPHFYEKQR